MHHQSAARAVIAQAACMPCIEGHVVPPASFEQLSAQQSLSIPSCTLQDTVGGMARTADDLILLDSIIRDSDASTTGNGAVSSPVTCAAPISSNFTSLEGVRLGLPSTFGFVTASISDEVRLTAVLKAAPT